MPLIILIQGLGVELKYGKNPIVKTNDGKWTPICGHWFWDNNYGASMFCRKLNPKYKQGSQSICKWAVFIHRGVALSKKQVATL